MAGRVADQQQGQHEHRYAPAVPAMTSLANLTKGEGEAAAGLGGLVTLAAAMTTQGIRRGMLLQPEQADTLWSPLAGAGSNSVTCSALVF